MPDDASSAPTGKPLIRLEGPVLQSALKKTSAQVDLLIGRSSTDLFTGLDWHVSTGLVSFQQGQAAHKEALPQWINW